MKSTLRRSLIGLVRVFSRHNVIHAGIWITVDSLLLVVFEFANHFQSGFEGGWGGGGTEGKGLKVYGNEGAGVFGSGRVERE